MAFVSCTTGNTENNRSINSPESDLIILTKENIEQNAIEFTEVRKQPFSEWLNVRGIIDVPPASRASVSSYFGGYIDNINILPGQRVKKGEVLFVLRNPAFVELQQEYMEALQVLKYQELEIKRQQQLYDEKVIPERDFNRSQSEYMVAKTNLQGSLQELKMAHIDPSKVERGEIVSRVEISAPISGFVSQAMVNLGSFLQPEDVALEIINTDHIHLDLTVFEKDILKVREGQPIRYRVPESGNEIREGLVYLVSKTVSGEDRSVDVHGHVGDTSSAFMHGMFVEAEIEVGQDSLFAVPIRAVMETGDGYIVAVIKSETEKEIQIRLQRIDIGKKTRDLIEVKNATTLENKKLLLQPELLVDAPQLPIMVE